MSLGEEGKELAGLEELGSNNDGLFKNSSFNSLIEGEGWKNFD